MRYPFVRQGILDCPQVSVQSIQSCNADSSLSEETSSEDVNESDKGPTANGNTSTIRSAAAAGSDKIPQPSVPQALEKRTPSRNARRKATKRKLRRLGVLAGNTGNKASGSKATQNGRQAADSQAAGKQKGGSTALQPPTAGRQTADSQTADRQKATIKTAKGKTAAKGTATAQINGSPAQAPKNASQAAGTKVRQPPSPLENGRLVTFLHICHQKLAGSYSFWTSVCVFTVGSDARWLFEAAVHCHLPLLPLFTVLYRGFMTHATVSMSICL